MVMGLTTGRRDASASFELYPLTVSSSVGYEIHEFLAWEALLLDNRRYTQWMTLLGKDFTYRCLGRPDDERSYKLTLWHLRKRTQDQTSALVANTHRFVTNVIISHGPGPASYVVSSYVLVNYPGAEESDGGSVAVQRCDQLRRATDSFRIERRDLRMGPISPGTRELLGPL
jgi:3-phenylpropionate/cinnamic acid dioxygenase small subunit